MKKNITIIVLINIIVIMGIIAFYPKKLGGNVNSAGNLQVDSRGNLQVASNYRQNELINPILQVIATTTGGGLSTSTIYFKVTSIDSMGKQTAPSSEYSCNANYGNKCTVAFAQNPKASSTRVWMASTSNVYYGYLTATTTTVASPMVFNSTTSPALTAGVMPTEGNAYTW